jgi:hypothetical protein
MASAGLHEHPELLDEAIIDQHRALKSWCEELETGVMATAPGCDDASGPGGSGLLRIGLKGTEQ